MLWNSFPLVLAVLFALLFVNCSYLVDFLRWVVQTVAARSEKIAEEEKRCKLIADNAQKDLEEAIPALEAATEVNLCIFSVFPCHRDAVTDSVSLCSSVVTYYAMTRISRDCMISWKLKPFEEETIIACLKLLGKTHVKHYTSAFYGSCSIIFQLLYSWFFMSL